MGNAWVDTRRPSKGGTVVVLDTRRNPAPPRTPGEPQLRITTRGAAVLVALAFALLVACYFAGQARQASWCRHNPTQAATTAACQNGNSR
jgi:hypothetical protein